METGQEIGQAEGLPNETIASAPAQKVWTAEEVNDLVAYKQAKAVEKYQRQQEQNGMQQAKPLDVEAIAAAAAQKALEQVKAERQADEQKFLAAEHVKAQKALEQKLLEGKKKYEDFDEVVATFSGASYPAVVWAADQLPNTADVIYELSNNPEKAARLQLLADKNDIGALERGMKKLSESIIQNEEAKKQPKAAAPYNKIKPGVASASSGDMGIDDFARAFRH